MAFDERTRLLVGNEAVDRLKAAHIIVFGIGGVGGYTTEALARAGVGKLTLVDADVVSDSNRNRQLLALTSTIGQPKVEVAARRIAEINPDCVVETIQLFYGPDTADAIDFSGADYVVDAIDTVSAKLELIARAKAANVPVICSMGTGNKIHPELLTLTTLDQTSGCPLAKVMRVECRKRGLTDVQVVYSTEPARKCFVPDTEGTGRHAPGSISFVPGTAGLLLAGKVIRDITGLD